MYRYDGNGTTGKPNVQRPGADRLHPAWDQFIRYCEELQFGDLEKVRIQNGIPMLVEVTTKKVKFGP